MNYIFDIGNVLLRFKPKDFLQMLCSDEETVQQLYMLIFRSPEWLLLDKGTITPAQATAHFCNQVPTHRELIQTIMEQWKHILTPLEESVLFMREVKKNGHAAYYLSNFHEDASQYVLAQYPFFQQFNGGIFSWSVNLLKPDAQIYRHLLETYRLNAEDCIFIDDTRANVDTAVRLGMKGVLFTSVEDIRRP